MANPLRGGRGGGRGAGQLALRYFEQAQFKVEWKHDDSPVTVADREAEAAPAPDPASTPSPTTASSARSTATRPARPASAGSSTPSTARATSSAAFRSGPRWSAWNTRASRSPASPRRRPCAHTWRALRGDGAYRGDRRIHVSDVADLSKSTAVLFQPVVVREGGQAGRVPGTDAADGTAARLRRLLRPSCSWRRGPASSWSSTASTPGTWPRSSRSSRRPAAASPTGTAAATSTGRTCSSATASCTTRSWPSSRGKK